MRHGKRTRRWIAAGASSAAVALAVAAPASATFPGQNGELAFEQRFGHSQPPLVYSLALDGSPKRRITENFGGDERDHHPAWSADGLQIATSMYLSMQRIRIAGADATGHRTLHGAVDGHHEEPAWSPDGARVAFSVANDARRDLWVMDADGLNPVQLTTTTDEDEHAPSWSPDGSLIAFAGEQGIYTIAPDGTGIEQLTDQAGDDHPDWSPDGTRIAFQRAEDIWVMGAGGADPTRLTTHDGHDGDPTWSPDGTLIAYVSSRDHETHSGSLLYTMHLDGGNITRVATGDLNFVYDAPSWQPVPFAEESAPPVCSNRSRSTKLGQAVKVSLSCTDPNGDPLTYSIVGGPGRGSLGAIDQATASVVYTPSESGTDSFTFRASDGGLDSDVAKVDIFVIPPPPPPPAPYTGAPVIFIPGFLASEIQCTTVTGAKLDLWPGALTALTRWPLMELASDGRSPATQLPCNKSAGPTGKPVHSALGGQYNVHGKTLGWLAQSFGGAGYAFGYDWRKSPEEALAALDSFVDYVRGRHAGRKVSIYTHSNGGLLTRWYIDSPARAAKVGRVLALGVPWWGTPKPWLTTAYGVQTPTLYELGPDILVPNVVLKSFAKNLAGLYHLFPGPAWYAHSGLHSKWLKTSFGDNESAVWKAVKAWGGNEALLKQASAKRAAHIEGFKTNGVDFRILAVSGRPTLGHVESAVTPPNPAAMAWQSAKVAYTNGDTTVALASQRQATAGKPQLGQSVPTYYTCGIRHNSEPEHPHIQARAAAFLAHGHNIPFDAAASTTPGLITQNPCPLDQYALEVLVGIANPRVDYELTTALAQSSGHRSRRASTASSAGPMTLDQAEAAGLVDVITDGLRTLITTTTDRSLTIAVKGRGFLTRTARLTDDGARSRRTWQRVSGTAKFTLRPGSAPVARRAGKPLKAARRDRRPPRTTSQLRRRGKRAVLTFRAVDRSGVAATWVRVGKREPVRLGRSQRIAVPWKRRRAVRFSSVDLLQNVERTRRLRLGGR